MSRVKLSDLQTPAILADLDILEKNIRGYCQEAERCWKQIWPMVKTHKSTEIARMQAEAGCTGFLCGTLDECEALAGAGFQNIMYAYPVAADVSVGRVIALAKRCNFFVRLDCLESAGAVNAAAEKSGVRIPYTIIIDSGLHRFGIDPEKAAVFADSMKPYKNLVFKGISSHPGHVYAASCHTDLAAYTADERSAMRTAAEALTAGGYRPEIVSSGSTPTFRGAVDDKYIQIYHPGNYVFNDAIQLSTGTAAEEDCALTVLASVISHPRGNVFICDAGAKCLGLDQGAHGNSSIKGYGVVKGHPEATVCGLSEEVGKLMIEGETSLKVGDLIRIIPNHACSAANLTRYYVGVRGERVERLIEVDIRGNSTKKGAAV